MSDGSPWEFDNRQNVRRYRDTRSGRFIGPATMTRLRDRWIGARRSAVAEITDGLISGSIDLGNWELRIRDELRIAHGASFLFGRGGRNAMNADDWITVDRELARQLDYLHRFAADLADGKLTAGRASTRARLYPGAARASYERGRQAAYGIPSLSQHPGDGNTQCLGNCLCTLSIQETRTQWRVTWRLGAAEHCPDCIGMSNRWNPLVIDRPTARVAEAA